jgi:hypothetical protein
MKPQALCSIVSVLVAAPTLLPAQSERAHDPVPLKPWPAPLYWQPTQAEARAIAGVPEASIPVPEATTPAGALAFVGMTPCRVVDTRNFTGLFGPPALSANVTRNFPLQSGSPCPIPGNALAYSLNVTVVPPGGLGYLTIWPQGLTQPVVSTLNDLLGTIVANAAIVPAGNPNGGISVFASNDTNLVIDINGYFTTQTGITLAAGSQSAPSLSFAGDSGTGIFSSGLGTLNFATAGVNRFTITSSGDLDLAGDIRKGGTLFLHNRGVNNTSVGLNALAGSTGGNNTSVGANALMNDTTGMSNTAAGSGALSTNTSGNADAAFGAGALAANTTGTFDTATGWKALFSNTTGFENTAFGASSLLRNTDGFNNTATGYEALEENDHGSNNTATGVLALFDNRAGTDNTADGFEALEFGLGSFNVAVGSQALLNTTSDSNIAIGYLSGSNLTNGCCNIMIGNSGVAGEANTIRIGNSFQHGRTFITAIRGVTTGASNAVPVMIDSNGQLGTTSSSRRFKEDIRDMGEASANLLRLRPVTFRLKQPYADGSKPLDYGLIAEEVAEIYPDLVGRGKDGQIENVQYHKLAPMLLNELQKEHEHARQQDEIIATLQARLEALEAMLATKTKAAQ